MTNKKITGLQRVSKLFYKRVANWVRTVYRRPILRISENICQNPDNTESLIFPSRAMIEEAHAEGCIHSLVGFTNNEDSGLGDCFNFIMSNGSTNQQRDGT